MSEPVVIQSQLIDFADSVAKAYVDEVIKNWDETAEEQVFPCNQCGFSLKVQYKGKPKYWIEKNLLWYLIISAYLVVVKEEEVKIFTRSGNLILKTHQELNHYADQEFSAFHRDHASEVFADKEVATLYTEGSMEGDQYVAKNILIVTDETEQNYEVNHRFNFKIPNDEKVAVFLFCSACVWSMSPIQPDSAFYNILVSSAIGAIKNAYKLVNEAGLVQSPEDMPHATVIHSYFMIDDVMHHGFILRYSYSEDSGLRDHDGHRFYVGAQRGAVSWHQPCGYAYLGDVVNLAEKNSTPARLN